MSFTIHHSRFLRFTIHDSRFTNTIFTAALLAITILLFSAGRAAAQEPSPLIVDADEVIYDQALGRGTYFTIQAIYNTGVSGFEDLDYIITSRLCDCIDISLKYRQVRQEIWLEVGLAAFPQSRLQLQLPGP